MPHARIAEMAAKANDYPFYPAFFRSSSYSPA